MEKIKRNIIEHTIEEYINVFTSRLSDKAKEIFIKNAYVTGQFIPDIYHNDNFNDIDIFLKTKEAADFFKNQKNQTILYQHLIIHNMLLII